MRQPALVVATDFTRILNSVSDDERLVSERLLPLVYDELRRLAAAHMAREPAGHTLQPTALVHEAWLRLAGPEECSWQNRAHFFGAAAQAMRRILVDHSRRKAADKRQADIAILPRTPDELVSPEQGDHILLVHESLEILERTDPEAARIVLLKFFCGLDSTAIAPMLGCNARAVDRRWLLARAKLYQIIRRDDVIRKHSSP